MTKSIFTVLIALLLIPGPSFAIDWKYWGDGRAEVSRYEGTIKRYGEPRKVEVTWIFVTEPFSKKDRVKADEGKHPPGDVFQVVKLNDIRDFQTGIYPYHLMSSVFGEIGQSKGMIVPLTPTKLVFSSQEWCGTTFTEMKKDGMSADYMEHSYFDGEADREHSIKLTEDVVFEDALPLLLHQIDGDLEALLTRKKFTVVTSALAARFLHNPVRKGEGTIESAKETEIIKVAGRSFKSRRWRLTLPRDQELLVWTESEKPHRILRWKQSDEFTIDLIGTKRLPYWKLNQPGGEKVGSQIRGSVEP
jgi:hypothetical protein